MRFVMAVFGLLASVVGSNWLLFGVGLVATKNIICFDVCNDYNYGPNQFWMYLGGCVLLSGVLVLVWGFGRKSK